MTVAELIEKLREFDQDLPVCLADWNEEYELPSESAATVVTECLGMYRGEEGEQINGSFVCLGGDGEQ